MNMPWKKMKDTPPCLYFLVILFALPLNLKGQDVIIKKDGLVIHADVMKVGLEVIEYKRADYEDGPVYEIYRDNVYAIAYENKRNDYFDVPGNAPFYAPPKPDSIAEPAATTNMQKLFAGKNFMNKFYGSVGIGYVGTYSKAEDGVEDATQSGSFPIIYLRAFTDINPRTQLGLQTAFGSYEYSRGGPNQYDNLVNFSNIDENVFSITVFGRYALPTGFVKPYGLFGFGLKRSRIDSELNLSFEEQEDIYQLTSSTQTLNFSVVIRAGVKIPIVERLNFYSDIGTGVNLGQIGLEMAIN